MLLTHPAVTVIIPSYNRAHVVKRAIKSVLAQTYQHFEIIIVDDGSTDNTAEVVKSIADDRVKYIRHDVNKGTPAAARNTGIREASGEFVGFVDSDDEWLPGKLEKQIEKFLSSAPGVGVVYGGYAVLDEKTGRVMGEVHPKKRGHIFEEVLKLLIPATPLVHLVKRECFDRVGLFDEDLRFAEDFDMWLRIAEQYEFDFVDEVVAVYHVSQTQITSDRVRASDGFLKFMAKHQQTLSKYPDALAHQLKYAGQCYLVRHDYASARRYFAQAIRANPRGLYLYAHLLASCIAPNLYSAILSDPHKILTFNKYRAAVSRFWKTR